MTSHERTTRPFSSWFSRSTLSVSRMAWHLIWIPSILPCHSSHYPSLDHPQPCLINCTSPHLCLHLFSGFSCIIVCSTRSWDNASPVDPETWNCVTPLHFSTKPTPILLPPLLPLLLTTSSVWLSVPHRILWGALAEEPFWSLGCCFA